MNPPLPPIIKPLKEEEVKEEIQLGPVGIAPTKRFVICISKELEKEVVRALQNYGKMLVFEDHMNNLNPDTFEFDYLVLDLRRKQDRYFFLKQIKPVEAKYNVLLYCSSYEVDDLKDDAHYDNVLTSFPMRQARKKDFDDLMLVERLPKPRWYVSLFKCLFKWYHSGK
jgi:hypothetical protein